MRELGLHILDIVENGLAAGATRVSLFIDEDMQADRLTIEVQDNGRGMDAETAKRVRDPFYTTRATRHVGLGIPLFAAAAERCAGRLDIESAPGKGTTITAAFQHSHIDRAPLGDMTKTLLSILCYEHSAGREFDLVYRHRLLRAGGTTDRTFALDTAEIKQILGDVPLTFPDVREWLRVYIAEGEHELARQAE